MRLAVPRRVYTQSRMDYVTEVITEVFERCEQIRGLRITQGPKVLRHFTARFEEI